MNKDDVLRDKWRSARAKKILIELILFGESGDAKLLLNDIPAKHIRSACGRLHIRIPSKDFSYNGVFDYLNSLDESAYCKLHDRMLQNHSNDCVRIIQNFNGNA